MPKLPRLTAKNLIRILEKRGFFSGRINDFRGWLEATIFSAETVGNSIEALTQKAGDANFTGQIFLNVYRFSNSGLIFQVIDNGPGFPEEQLDKISEQQFTTKKNSGTVKSLQFGGQGVHLKNCRIVAKQNGWELIVKNDEITKGASVTLIIPPLV